MSKLTAEDREALRFARAVMQHSIKGLRERFGRNVSINPLTKHAVVVIGRLLRESTPAQAERSEDVSEEKQSVARVLRAAADRIERDGWCQGGSGRVGARCCMVLALRFECDRLDVNAYWPAMEVLGGRIPPPYGLMPWNDAPGRTVDEVLAALRGAAAEVTP